MAIFTIRELSLRQRLLLLTMVTSGIAVLFGCFGFLLYDLHVTRQQKVEELQNGMDGYVSKPIQVELLRAKIDG
jgi:hypothetical protein